MLGFMPRRAAERGALMERLAGIDVPARRSISAPRSAARRA